MLRPNVATIHPRVATKTSRRIRERHSCWLRLLTNVAIRVTQPPMWAPAEAAEEQNCRHEAPSDQRMSKFSCDLLSVTCQNCRFNVQNHPFASASFGSNLGNWLREPSRIPCWQWNRESALSGRRLRTESTNARTGRFVVRAVMGTARL